MKRNRTDTSQGMKIVMKSSVLQVVKGVVTSVRLTAGSALVVVVTATLVLQV